MNETASLTLIHGQVIDGSGAPPIADGVVVVRGTDIAWAGETKALPDAFRDPDAVRLGGPGHTVMPGLIDGHIHIAFGEARSEEENALYTPVEYRSIRAMWFARKVLRAGVTSAFDAATTFNIAVSVRDAIEAGLFEGPRLAVCGKQLTTHQGLEASFPTWMPWPPGQAGVLVTSRDQIVDTIRLQIREGVDCIKVSGSSDAAISNAPIEGSAFGGDELKLIADETHRLQRVCTIHARSRESALLAAKAGFDWIMHASFIDDEGIEWCLKHDVAIVPTLTLLANIIASARPGAGASAVDAFRREYEAAGENLARAHKAGVRLVAGSESGWSLVPFGEWHAKELQIFVEHLGLDPMQAIVSATSQAARLLPHASDRIGRLAAGKAADILLVEGDPLTDITVLQKPSRRKAVLKDGRSVDLQTPIRERRIWPYEKNQTFLDGWFRYDESLGGGRIV